MLEKLVRSDARATGDPSVENSHECVYLYWKKKEKMTTSQPVFAQSRILCSELEIWAGHSSLNLLAIPFPLNSRWLEDFVDQQEGPFVIEEACSLIDDNSWANVMLCVTILLANALVQLPLLLSFFLNVSCSV